MNEPVFITPQFAVTSAMAAEDFPTAAAMGFRSIISNRPDGEAVDQLPAAEAADQASQAGLAYRHVPAAKLDLFTDPVVDGMRDAMAMLEGPILAHCASGLRSAIVWAAASARSQDVDGILAALDKAGFDLAFLRDELDEQAQRGGGI
jgi:sulfide:quinone oxidoreductase